MYSNVDMANYNNNLLSDANRQMVDVGIRAIELPKKSKRQMIKSKYQYEDE